ncbi:MAG: LemA family protein [Cytophagaceae bacterium]|nr:LemA family protein [Cytophagaceae bacterium]MDW8456067.1 LemA family protein [Cytophagaceae bacterium]
MKKLILIHSIIVTLAVSSCSEMKNNTISKQDSLAIDSTLALLKSLNDSVEHAWKRMIASDDQKIADMKRLLLEISYCKTYNAALHDSLTKAVETLAQSRYNQETMSVSKNIDDYDHKTNLLISRIMYLCNQTPELSSHPIAERLITDITTADNEVWRYRKVYDEWAMQYNEVLVKNEELLKKSVKEFSALKKKNVFTIGSAS